VGEVDALELVGLSTAKWADEASCDPLMRSIGVYMALLETSLTTGEAAGYLKVDVSRIRQRLGARSVRGVCADSGNSILVIDEWRRNGVRTQ
jgi:hypothetical protein